MQRVRSTYLSGQKAKYARSRASLRSTEPGVRARRAAAAGEPGGEFQILHIPRSSSLAGLSGRMPAFPDQLPKDGGLPLTQINPLP
jgi:hypothetical protein